MLTSILLICLILGTHVHCEEPIVEIANGRIKGEVMSTPNNRSFYAFRGIPYAKPPLGDLRFQPPQKPDNWTGILDSDAKDRICIQLIPNIKGSESEDCLYIHVYTPQIPTENRKVSIPVMYVIHGGGFVGGTPGTEELGPHYLMDYDIIVVSVGYRLGFLGFLSTGDLECPGNNGLKDQQFGLRWVQQNIRKFGGDPDKVTIFGESAGAVSVGLHLLAENSKDLFIGAIQDSGSSLANWALQENPRHLAYEFGTQINSTINENTTSILDLLKFFRTLDIQQIKEASTALFGEDFTTNYYEIYQGHLFSGAIEPEHDGAFLTASPYQKFTTGDFNKVPTLLGVNSEESLFLSLDESLDKRMESFKTNSTLFVCSDMHIKDITIKSSVGRKIEEIYIPSSHSLLDQGGFIKFFSDSTFVKPTIKQAQMQSNYSDVYFYEFGYSGQIGRRFSLPDVPGTEKVVHAEEMMYLFHRNDAKDIFAFPVEDRITMKRMLTMWSNFVKYQNPTPQNNEILDDIIWPRIQSCFEKIPYLSINSSLEVKYDYKKRMMDEYHELYDTYSVPPLFTY